ncbi:hypothetical protein [Gemmatimonas sp. UBA7669]|uniref:hypothetical protein n=1 Tax=Gemmatimonas sp. UBA7669 TaxID=1946568 RepID=UPI0025C1489A|nr:hypothetical protein [Gemmatimonas sp. UBA7669]
MTGDTPAAATFTLRRVSMLGGVLLATAAVVWFTWPRPDTLIRIGEDGVAVVVDRFGRLAPLPDTVEVGGSGTRRVIRVENRDTANHRLAMFNIPAGERNDYTVPRGVFGGECSAHPTKRQLTFRIR